MRAVILDSYALKEGDLNWRGVEQLVSELEIYSRTSDEQAVCRLKNADVAIINKVNINEQVLKACPNLKWIGLTATGFDTLDIKACRRFNVGVANVPAYSTHSVAQMAFALLLEICNSAGNYNKSVSNGNWQTDIKPDANILPHAELYGKTLGIIGYGNIAKQVAKIAFAFGMNIICHTRTVKKEYENNAISFVSFEYLMQNSDIISLHCPANEQTRGMINEKTLLLCKENVRIVNTARGTLIDEYAMANALNSGKVCAFATDVLTCEPIRSDNVLLSAKNCIITPHIAWATPEALSRLSDTITQNLQSFINGGTLNIIN